MSAAAGAGAGSGAENSMPSHILAPPPPPSILVVDPEHSRTLARSLSRAPSLTRARALSSSLDRHPSRGLGSAPAASTVIVGAHHLPHRLPLLQPHQALLPKLLSCRGLLHTNDWGTTRTARPPPLPACRTVGGTSDDPTRGTRGTNPVNHVY